MDPWLSELLALYLDDGNWERRRRQIITHRWPDAAVRAAEQDARLGRTEALALYDAEVEAIKAAIPKL